MSDGFLHRYFLNNGDKKIHKWIHYFDMYERHLGRFRNKSPVMLEIGVFGGGSLKMWKDYLGAGSRIIGIDINPVCKQYEEEGIEIFIGSQDDPNVINQIFEKYPNIDIVLDDGSHIMNHMITSFELKYNRVNLNGVYIVEDTHTCYWDSYGGGLKREGSFMEFVKHKLDEMNAQYTQGELPISYFTLSTDYIACYDSVVVFERKPQGKRQSIMTGSVLQNASN